MNDKKNVFKTFALISQLGFSIIGPIILCTVLGVYLDEKFALSSTVWLIIVGVLAGVRNAYELVRHASEEPEDKNNEET